MLSHGAQTQSTRVSPKHLAAHFYGTVLNRVILSVVEGSALFLFAAVMVRLRPTGSAHHDAFRMFRIRPARFFGIALVLSKSPVAQNDAGQPQHERGSVALSPPTFSILSRNQRKVKKKSPRVP